MAVDLGFDEGGFSDTLLMSVQAGITEQARSMKRKWRKRLGNVRFFHSVDFENFSNGVFTDAGLNRQDREELLTDLCKLLHQRLLCGVTARVSQSLYDRLTTNEFRSQHGTAYSFLVDMCLLSAFLQVEAKGLKPELNIVVEEGHRHSKQVHGILQTLKESPTLTLFKILTNALGSKADHPILQSADMLVYSEWKSISNGSRVIWDAIHKREYGYVPFIVDCDERSITEFVAGPERFKKKRMQEWRDKYTGGNNGKQGISAIQSNNETPDSSSAQRDKS